MELLSHSGLGTGTQTPRPNGAGRPSLVPWPTPKSIQAGNGRVAQKDSGKRTDTFHPNPHAFLLSSIVDAIEGRDVAVTDIKGAYLNAKMKDEVLMKIT